MALRRVAATRFVNSMMEGGSRPALIKADDGRQYIVKLRGAAQGVAPLAAEIIVGEIARALGHTLPEVVLVDMDATMGKGEPDPELRELLQWSAGTNVGLAFIEEATMFDRASEQSVDPLLASRIAWLDAFTLNIDRTPANPNLLLHGEQIHLIDHGAALYFHFHWAGVQGKAQDPFALVRHHVLLPWASAVQEAARSAHELLNGERLREIVAMVPDHLFATGEEKPTAEQQREMYAEFLIERLRCSRIFEEEVERAYEAAIPVRRDPRGSAR